MRPTCSNDAFDATTGVDTQDRKPESFVNLTGLKWPIVVAIAFMLLLLGIATLSVPLAAAQSRLPMLLLTGAISCGYLYQGPPFR
jgi:2-carboxy-1,4-naphthoquinone phytyltransferase